MPKQKEGLRETDMEKGAKAIRVRRNSQTVDNQRCQKSIPPNPAYSHQKFSCLCRPICKLRSSISQLCCLRFLLFKVPSCIVASSSCYATHCHQAPSCPAVPNRIMGWPPLWTLDIGLWILYISSHQDTLIFVLQPIMASPMLSSTIQANEQRY